MRVEQLTFTRFIAAMAVVFMHFGKHVFPFSHDSINFLVKAGGLGVSYFFILSGFVMIIAYGRRKEINFLEYIKNRFARIYPVYLLGLMLVLYYIHNIGFEKISFTNFLIHLFALQAWTPENALTLNFPGWSLSVEFFFYLLFPLLMNYIYLKKKFATIFWFVLIFWSLSIWFINWGLNDNIFYINEKFTHNLLYYAPIFHLNQFLIGNLAGIYYLKILQKKNRNNDLAIIFLLLFLVILLKFKLPIDYHNGFLAIIFVPLIILISTNNGSFTSFFNKKTAIYLGEISYSIYILHYPVHLFTEYFMGKFGITGDLKLLVLYIPILIVLSALSYSYIETPLREKLKEIRF